jgi:hypothetical protein
MQDVAKRAALALGLSILAAPTAWAAGWVSVAKSDRVEVFVDTGSLSRNGDVTSAITKENYVEAQPAAKKGKTYLSARNDYRIDCAQRKLAYRANKVFAGADLSGEIVQKATSSDKNLKWMEAPEGTVFGELLDYACKNAPVAAPAPAK